MVRRLKVKVGKSTKSNGEFHYYEIESDDVPMANLEQTKNWLDKIVTGWLNQANSKPENDNEEIGNGNQKVKPHSGKCVHCGKPIDPKYIQCYDCWKKHQD